VRLGAYKVRLGAYKGLVCLHIYIYRALVRMQVYVYRDLLCVSKSHMHT